MSDPAATIPVRLGERSYDVLVGPGLLETLGPIVAGRVAANPRAKIIADERVPPRFVESAQTSLGAAGFTPTTVRMAADEPHKTLATVGSLYAAMLAAGLDRGSPVVALGGGIVGDTAGFAAATFLRGVPLVLAPTTLLAMVDASVGGKTGVNVPIPGGGLGKNQVGAFWQPRAVVADTDVLASLDGRTLRGGLAECVKAALIADAALLSFIEDRAEAILARSASALAELIERCVRIKAAIVESDERESGRRAWLNLGHTFAHAIEAQPGLGLSHGEAVAVGLAAAARYAAGSQRLTEHERRRVVAVLERLGLPVRLPRAVDVEPLLAAMRYDKKVSAGRLRLVVPAGLGAVEIEDCVDEKLLRAAWQSVAGGPVSG
jgi:3-dehydroquinate synthase